MKTTEIQRLRRTATAFHDAITQTDFSRTGLNLRNFPFECCHHATSLLGVFLHEGAFAGITKMSGRRPDGEDGKHHWLEINGIVVDITAYQFADVDEKVIVSQSSGWHSALDGKPLPLGVEGESEQEYFERIKAFYNEQYDDLYDRLAETARRGC